MGKLVRDGIPDKIRRNGEEPIVRVLTDEENLQALIQKLLEESKEVATADTRVKMVEELADLAEVMKALMLAKKISTTEVLLIQQLKYDTVGGFDGKLFLEGVKEKAIAA